MFLLVQNPPASVSLASVFGPSSFDVQVVKSVKKNSRPASPLADGAEGGENEEEEEGG